MKDKTDKDKYINFSGSSQQTRYPYALDKNYVKVDERSFEKNLAYIYGLSKFIKFIDTNGDENNDWSGFLIDEAVVLAAISFNNPANIELRFKTYMRKALGFNSRSKKLHYYNKAFGEVYALIFKFDTWYANLKYVEDFTSTEVNIRSEIANTITQKLLRPFITFISVHKAALKELKLDKGEGFSLDKLSYIWDAGGIDAADYQLNGGSEKQKFAHLYDTLLIIFQHFYESLIYIRQKAIDHLGKTVNSDHHFPEVALLLSFLDIYKYPQNQLNKLIQKYQDYYYDNILKQTLRKPQDAQVYLSFKLDNLVDKVEVDKSTAFIAGADSTGKNILFETDYPAEINRAEVVSIKNVFLEKILSQKAGKSYDLVGNLYCNEIPVNSGILKDESIKRTSYATFGEKQLGKGINDRTMDYALLGYAISSPVLFLRGGHREIDLVLDFKGDGFKEMQNKLDLYAKLLNNSNQEIISKTFTDAFNIELSGENGWLNIKKYAVILDKDHSSIVIRFDLLSDQEAIIACSQAVHKESFGTGYPVLKVALNNHSYIYPYFLLNKMALEQITIQVEVKGVKDLVVYNNVGPVNIDNPFYPFGPIPSLGSYMLIGNNEVFQKQLDDLEIQLDWYELPTDNLGFYDHYKGYNEEIDNTSFEGELSILKGGKWIPDDKEERQTIKLFRTEGGKSKDSPLARGILQDKVSVNHIDMSQLRYDFNFDEINKSLSYSSQSQRGFIKLELSGSRFAFGHSIYPNILSEVTIENSKSGLLKGNKKKELPKQPYTPQLKGLSLDYKSAASISIRDAQSADTKTLDKYGQFFHLHPFGKEKIFPSTNAMAVELIPSYDYVGGLFIGIKDVKAPQVISILFEMLDEFTISSEEEPPKIEWKFLANNIWHTIEPESIVRDDTNGFLRTGIIMIAISADINRNNTVLDSSLFWLSVECKGKPEGASNIISVNSQVLKATLVGNENVYNSDFLEKGLPVNTIQTPYKNIKGIRSVLQPLPSFNNKATERKVEFQTRVSERLKHRSRAINCADYERLVLDKFREIERATCLPNMSSNNLSSPGNILLVVSPYSNNVVNAEEPRTSSELLYEIKSYLKQFASPFVNIEVRNPSYERIRVMCSVKFKDSHNRGYYIQKLNEYINDYLSGNMGGNSYGSLVGKVVYCSDITTYLRALPFVETVVEFSIIQAATDLSGNYVLIDTAEENNEKDGLFATKPWSVLIPSKQHQVNVIDDNNEGNAKQAGIDNLLLGNDFIINE